MIRIYTAQEFDQNFYNWKITDITFTSNLPKLSPEEQRFGGYNIDEYFIVFYPNGLEKAIDAMAEILAKRIRQEGDIDSLKARLKHSMSDFRKALLALFSKIDFSLIIVYFHYNYLGERILTTITNVNAHVYVLGITDNKPSMIMVPKALYTHYLDLDRGFTTSTKGYNIKPYLYLFLLNLREGSDLYKLISIHPVFKENFKVKILQTFNINQRDLERMLNDEETGYYELILIVYKKFINQMMAKGDYKRLIKNIADTLFTADNIYDTLEQNGALYYLNDIVEYCIDAVIENVLTDMISNIMNQNPEIDTYDEIIDHISFEELENRVKESCLDYIRNSLVIDANFVYTYIFNFLVEEYYENNSYIEFMEDILSYAFDRKNIKIIKQLLHSIKVEAYQTGDIENYYDLIEELKEGVIAKYLRISFLALYDQQSDLFIRELREFMTMAFPELFPEVWEKYAENRLPNIISNIIAGQ